MGRESGQAAPLAIGLALLVLASAGLIVDLSRAFLVKRTLQNAADGAVLAGTGALDRERYYSTGGGEVVLEGSLAEGVARRWLARRGLEVRSRVRGDAATVEVHLQATVKTSLLRLIGLTTMEVSAAARGRPGAGGVPP